MSDLPEGWEWAIADELRDPTQVICYGILKAGPHKEGGVLMVRIKDFSSQRLDLRHMKRCDPERAAKFPRSVLRKGDILVSKDGTIGRVAIVPPELEGGNITQHVLRLPPSVELDNVFLARMIEAPSCQSWMKGETKGVALQGVNVGDFREMPIPVAPLNEQRRIVAKIEALQERSRAAQEALEAIPPLLDRFRQSVLAAAFRGDLTADWRAKNPNVEPASVLLDRIRQERRRRWEEDYLAKAKAKGKEPKNDKWKAKYKEPAPVDTEGLPELPEGWCWVCVEEVAESLNYGTAQKSQKEGGVPVLRMGNMQRGEIDWTDLVYTDDPKDIEKYALSPNTVLFNRTNSPPLVGKTAIYRGDRQAIFAGYLIRIQHLPGLDPDFLNYTLCSPWGRAWCWMVKSDGVSQSNISGSKLARFPLPLPPKSEQARIAQVTRTMLEQADSAANTLAMAEGRVSRLNESILAKAFRGELVPQDPNDEPASLLLERIRAEREAAPPNKKPRGRRSKKAKNAPPK